jgi:predicted ATP-dependent endonuclease of OLD family
MKLIAFSVRNHRSIVEAYKLSLGSYTDLVGPNNEGKSNIVKAIALSLAVLTHAEVDASHVAAIRAVSGAGFAMTVTSVIGRMLGLVAVG